VRHYRTDYEPSRLLLTRQEAAQSLAISLRALDRLIAGGELYSVRIGRSVRVDPRDLSAFLASRRDTDLNDHDPDVTRAAEEVDGDGVHAAE
jgi:excisionase family DNA binding protein